MTPRTGQPETTRDRVEPTDAPLEPPDVLEIDHAPSRLSQLTAIGLAILAPLNFIEYGLALGLVGTVLVGWGARGGNRLIIDGGGVFLIAGVCMGAIQGATVNTVLLAMVLSIVAWDVGRYGIVVGEQLGRTAVTTRIEVVHAVWSLTFGLLVLLVLSGANNLDVGRFGIGIWVLLIGLLVLILGLFVNEFDSTDGSSESAGAHSPVESLTTQSTTSDPGD